jgi:hypothetical protein
MVKLMWVALHSACTWYTRHFRVLLDILTGFDPLLLESDDIWSYTRLFRVLTSHKYRQHISKVYKGEGAFIVDKEIVQLLHEQ